MVAQTRRANPPAQVVFKEKLSARGLSSDQILKRLQNLYGQLEKQDQDVVDTTSLTNARNELIHKTILLHKDQGVRAYTACCLAELLRLYAPDAPYTQPELRDIFQFFIRQLKEGLKYADSAYHNQYFQLLESLSTVKSAVLVCDLPAGDELMLEFFTNFFWIVRRGSVNKKMESFMADILVALLDECQSVPQTVLDTILAQFMDKDTRLEQPAYRLAITVCNNVADKLQRPVCQYFTDIIVDSAALPRSLSPDSRASSPSSSTTFETLQNAHTLIQRLHATCPQVLHGVIPQLGEELRVDQVHIRQLATQALGEMYADKKNGLELATKYPATWEVWISRKNDKNVAIRLKFVECLKSLIVNLPVKRDALGEALEAKLLDPDDKIRTATCKLFSQLDYESALHNISENLLRAVAGRFLDKKAVVRSEALNSLGKLYGLAYPEIENNDAGATKHFGWIPDSILEVAGQSPLVRDVVQLVWAQHILPLTSPSPTAAGASSTAGGSAKGSGELDEVLWTEKFLNVMRHLSDKSIDILISISGIKEGRPGLCDKYLNACIKYNGGVIDEDEEKVIHELNFSIHALTGFVFASNPKCSEDLHAFAKSNENRLFKLLKTCFDPQSDIKLVAKASSDFLKRLSASTSSTSSTYTSTLTTLLFRGSLHIINHSSIPTLLKKLSLPHVQSTEAGKGRRSSTSTSVHIAAANAGTLLSAIAKWSPRLGRGHLSEIGRWITHSAIDGDDDDGDSDGGNISGGGQQTLEVALRLLANLIRSEKDVKIGGTSDRKLVNKISKIALGKKRRLSKFAARAIVLGVSNMTTAKDVLEKLVEGLVEAEEDLLAAHVAALVEYARYAPDMFEEVSEVVVESLVRKVLNVPIPDETPEDEEPTEEWYDDTTEVPPLLWAKISTLKLFRHRCWNTGTTATLAVRSEAAPSHKGKEKDGPQTNGTVGEGENEKAKAEKIVGPVMKMLQALMLHEGAMSENVQEEPRARSRMRLQASLTMLHLARIEIYLSLVMSNFSRVVLTIQDTCYGVRSTFLNKLITLFMTKKLPSPFGVIFFLTVHDPEEDVKGSASSCVSSLMKKLAPAQRVEYLELLFVRLLHTLAHHPDFSTGHEDLLDLAKYIQFYLDLIATSDNIALLYHLASKGKTVRDHSSFAHSENFYILCELSQDLIKARAATHSWSIQSYPGKVRMPPDILRPLPNAEAANRILKTTFLPDETREWVASLSQQQQSKGGGQKKEKKSAVGAATGGDKTDTASATVSTGKRKKRGSNVNGSGKKSKKSRGKDRWDSDENDEDDEEQEEQEQDEEDVEVSEDDKGEGEGKDEEGSDVEMEDAVVKDKAKGRGRPKASAVMGRGKTATTSTKPKSKQQSTTTKPKQKSREDREEESREARESKGLRTSARTRAKARASRKRPRLEASGDEEESNDDSDMVET